MNILNEYFNGARSTRAFRTADVVDIGIKSVAGHTDHTDLPSLPHLAGDSRILEPSPAHPPRH